ncbi:MAG: DapH/DapD/GlmU-related protein [Specibacter sp.]
MTHPYFANDPRSMHERMEAGVILAELIGPLGEDVELRPPLYVDYGRYIGIGPGAFINYTFTVLDVAPVTIGADVIMGPNVQPLTPTHPLESWLRRDKLEAARPITIGDNVWLGGGVIVLPGVTIGENTVVGARSVVTKDLPAHVVAAGEPGTHQQAACMSKQPAEGRPRRRYDPDRRANISDAALDVVAERGVAGRTYRKIAQRAGFSLGSLTYHCESLDELLGEAFTKLANHTADGFDEAMAQVGEEAAARAAVVSLIMGELLNDPRTMVLSCELYALATRRPDMRQVTDAWMARSRVALGKFFDPQTTLMLDALIEGLSMHRALSLTPMPRTTVEAAVERLGRTP